MKIKITMQLRFGLFILTLLTSNYGIADASSFPVTCIPQPLKDIEICSLSTQSEHFPVNDLVLYKREKDRFPVLLEVIKGDVAVSWFWGFSRHGKYTVMAFAEEGHPYFVVYETSRFLESEQRPTAIAILSDYFLSDLIVLEDDGTARFAKNHDTNREGENIDCFDPNIDRELHNDTCFVNINIFHKSHKPVN
ncbi:hypothetical protein [Aliiglaciecola aliphaticivorans]